MMARNKVLVVFYAATLLIAGLAVFATSASAQAQQNTMQVNCDNQTNGPIRPLGAPGIWNCNMIITYSSGGTGLSEPIQPGVIQVNTNTDVTWMTPIVSPSTLNFPYQQGESVTRSFTVTVPLSQQAPAFTPAKLEINPTVITQPRDNVVHISPTSVELTVTPDYFNLYNVRLDQKIGQAGPQEAFTYTVTIDNLSNGQTRFEFTLPEEGGVPEGFQAVPPEPLVLDSQATGGERTSQAVGFQVYTPYRNGYVNEIGSIRLLVDSFYAQDTSIEGASSQISTLTQSKGFYVPGPGAGLAALGVIGAALGLAHVRRDE